MTAPREIDAFSAEEGLTFLEHLAHQLTIAVRIAADNRQPHGPLSEEQSRRAMYWVNEATHNVVQLTRDIRIGRTKWNAVEIAGWIELWTNYKHAATYNQEAVERAISDTQTPYRHSTTPDR